ncbi:oligomeric Golgi complex subunit [Thraustotheca clavata]|uniref:Conserved oligomeric Golgi complex subunit 4 n=1 Tax=Thraustotheca clavata TaxID=74557 RepID=A0A1V9Z1C3_9STRA|nr:oligomeric Golgi complex subunit [Thraustotheca clavata]
MLMRNQVAMDKRRELEAIEAKERALLEEMEGFAKANQHKEALWRATEAVLKNHLVTEDEAASIHVLCRKTKNVATAIDGAHEVAEKMTREVRHLGKIQERVIAAIERSDGVLRVRHGMQRLQSCMNERNYKDAATCLRELRDIEALEIPIDVGDKLRMNSAENDIRDAIEKQMEIALHQKDEVTVLKMGSIFEPMLFAEEGASMILAFVATQLKDRLQVPSNINVSVQELTANLVQVFNSVAESTLRFEAIMLQSFASVRGAERLLQTVYTIGSPVAVQILNAYMKQKKLAESVNHAKAAHVQETNNAAAANTPTKPEAEQKDWNPQLNELAIVLQHSQTYERFIRAREIHYLSRSGAHESLLPSYNVSSLNNAVQELAAFYCALEDICLSISTKKALSMEEIRSISTEADSIRLIPVSSIIDEVFYVSRNCGCRALATGHVDSACGVMNLLATLLQTTVYDIFNTRVASIPREMRDAGPLVGLLTHLQSTQNLRDHVQTIATLGKKMTSRNINITPPTSSSGNKPASIVVAPPVTLNSITTILLYLSQLQKTLQSETKAAFQDPLPPQLKSCLNGLDDTTKTYSDLMTLGIKHIIGVFQPKLAAFLTPLIKKSSYDLTDAMFATNDVNDPYACALVAHIKSLLDPYEQHLARSIFERLVDAMAVVTADLLESLLVTKPPVFNQLGAMQLEKDIRVVSAYFGEKCQYSKQHHLAFGTLRQCVMVLNVDVPDDVLEFYGRPTTKGVVEWKLPASRVIELLQARTEFTTVEIAAIELK